MITRGLWPLQRWLAARPAVTIALASAPVVALAGWWRPPAALVPAAIATGVAMLAPVVIARGDGSRRRLAGRATGAALVIAQPLVLAALFVDLRLLFLIAAAAVIAVVLPAVVPVREVAAGAELAPESRSTHLRWLLPVVGLCVLVPIHARARVAIPDLDAGMIATVVGCAAICAGVSMRPLLGIGNAAAMLIALALFPSATTASPMAVAIALSIPLAAWFQRESSGGFPAWMPAVLAVAVGTAYAADPAWPLMAAVALLTWLVTAMYPAHASAADPEKRSTAGILAWSQRLFSGLEPYWRFYARGKLSGDPVYGRLAGDGRPWGCVLDAGCGPGLTAMVAAARGTTTYLGIDLDLDKLLVARRALQLSGRAIGDHWRLRRDQFPLEHPPSERFDTVLVLDILHYWPHELQATTLSQLASLLHADGRLYLREGVAADDGDAGHIERGERFTTYFGLNPENALTFLSAERIAALIASAGLTVESEEPMGNENRLWICRATPS